jgi:sulfide:quinone oxidoreductase
MTDPTIDGPVGSGHHRVLVIGGGNGGISVAARLRRRGVDDIAIVEPSDRHLYKPLFSHVAGGTARAGVTVRPQAKVMPKGVTWIRDAVTAVEPDSDLVILASGRRVGYDHLIVCPGIQKDWDGIPGAAEALKTPSAASHYEFEGAAKLSLLLRDLDHGTAVFTQPPDPATCAGASQKPMYQACDYWRAKGVRDGIRVVMVVPGASVSGIPHIDRELERKIAEYDIELRTSGRLVEVDSASGEVVIDVAGERERIAYDALDIVPPQSAPDWLKSSPLAAPDDPSGFVDVDPETLRHRRYANVWGLGDAAKTLNAKSGGALRKQTFVLAANLAAVLRGKLPGERYDSYTVCPYTVSRKTVVWAEFDHLGRPRPTIPFLPQMYRENRLAWIFDRHVLPWVYWNLILRGRV